MDLFNADEVSKLNCDYRLPPDPTENGLTAEKISLIIPLIITRLLIAKKSIKQLVSSWPLNLK